MEREGSESAKSWAKLTCSICLGAYKEPKVLPCCHTFCRTCLEGLAAKTEGKFKCPECRTEHDIPDRGVEGFLTDFSLGREVESKESGGKEAVCGEREGGERAVAYCHDCEAFVCEGCKLALHKAKRYRNHVIQSLSEEIFMHTVGYIFHTCRSRSHHQLTCVVGVMRAPHVLSIHYFSARER